MLIVLILYLEGLTRVVNIINVKPSLILAVYVFGHDINVIIFWMSQ